MLIKSWRIKVNWIKRAIFADFIINKKVIIIKSTLTATYVFSRINQIVLNKTEKSINLAIKIENISFWKLSKIYLKLTSSITKFKQSID